MSKLELVSGWLNEHADQLAMDLGIQIDNDSPLWQPLEQIILDTFQKAKIENAEEFMHEINLHEACDAAVDGLFNSLKEQIKNSSCPPNLQEDLFHLCNEEITIKVK